MASVLIGNSCQTQTLQGLGRMGVVGMMMGCNNKNEHVQWDDGMMVMMMG